MRKVRTLRHWKQQYDKNAKFIFRRPVVYMGKQYHPGDPIPEALKNNKTKLYRFWDSGAIELAEFDESKGIVDEFGLDLPDGIEVPDDLSIEKGKGSWFTVNVKDRDQPLKFNGKGRLAEFIVQLVATRAKEAEEALEQAKQLREMTIAAFADFGVTLTDELLEGLDDDQLAELDEYLGALERGDEDIEAPEFVPKSSRDLLIERAAAVDVVLDDELLDLIDDDQRVQLEAYLVALEEGSQTETPEFLAAETPSDDDENPDDETGPIDGADSEDGHKTTVE